MVYQVVRIFLGLIFLTSGMGKVWAGHKFPGVIGPVWLADRLAPYQLGFFAQFIAYSQMVIGFLLLSRSWTTVGAIACVPLITCILMVTISLAWRGTPYVNGFLLALNLYLLWHDREKLRGLLGSVDARWIGALVLIGSAPRLSYENLWFGYGAVAMGWLLASGLGQRRKGEGSAKTAQV